MQDNVKALVGPRSDEIAREQIEACFSADYHLRHVDQIFERVFGRSR